MAVASFVISVLAFLAAGTALWYSHRQAVAAERSADADQRSVALAEAEAAKYAPPWSVRSEGRDALLLANDSDEPAHDVTIDLGDISVHGDLAYSRIGPGSAIRLFTFRSFGTQTDTITVKWRRQPDAPELDWEYPLPANPRT
ncbi:hypothetical protein [Promicromonospora sp. NPDC060271]|uniref:hypothetical protein n=1 Tax=Promicromonospora sp. NPDC060271 TaxID=3347089 RepID=UPI0036614628